MSLVAHVAVVLFILFAPRGLFQPSRIPATAVQRDQEPLRFVEVVPLVDKTAPPRPKADESDRDRRSATRERAPKPDNPEPFLRGTSPEKILGGRSARAAGPRQPQPAQSQPAASPPLPQAQTQIASNDDMAPVLAPRPAPTSGNLGDALRNLQQYLRNETYDNVRGGSADQSADIQFDSMGVDFGPWLRRFKNQVERNWLVPEAAMSYKGRVVLQFYVLRNGTITGLRVVQPAAIPALTTAAINALKMSNPTTVLPPEYPADRVYFTVTFHYNENPQGAS